MKCVYVILLYLMIPFSGYCQGKINKSKDELINKSKSKVKNRTESNSRRSLIEDLELGFFGEVFLESFLFLSYHTFIGDSYNEEHLHSSFTKYPFYDNASINYQPLGKEYPTKKLRFDIEGSSLIESPITLGSHLKIKLRPVNLFYFQVDYFEIFETGILNSRNSNISIFNFNFCYDRIRFEKFNVGWTLGVNYIANEVQEGGLSAGINSDVFLAKQLSLFGSARWSSVDKVPVNEFEIKLKYHNKNYFGSIGYEKLKIGTPTYNFLAVGAGAYF